MRKEPTIIRKKQFKLLMKKADPQAFITISENVHIIGRFVEVED